jgi:hypothetical protein
LRKGQQALKEQQDLRVTAVEVAARQVPRGPLVRPARKVSKESLELPDRRVLRAQRALVFKARPGLQGPPAQQDLQDRLVRERKV